MVNKSNDRILLLRDLLFQETDEDHELNIKELMERMRALLNIDKIDQRTVRNDLDSLQRMDFDIVKNVHRHGQIYYSHQDKLFETYQIRTLVDAILSARFITPKEKGILIDKLKELTSIYIRKTLPEPFLFSQSINVDYHMIKLNIDHVHQAITDSKVLKYKYGSYNVNKLFEYRREGKYYFVEPYALIWQNDLYYLIGRFLETNELRHYRLDRMRKIEVTDQLFKKDVTFELQSYIDNSFQMFSGLDAEITIRFQSGLLNAIYDRFGLDANVQEDGEEHFILHAKAKISDGLLGWILQWGTGAKVLAPKSLVERVAEEVRKMANTYN